MGAPRQSESATGAVTQAISAEEKTIEKTGMLTEFRTLISGVSVPASATTCICSRQRQIGHSFFMVLAEQHE